MSWEMTNSRMFLEVLEVGLTDPGGRAYTSLVWIQGVHLAPPLAELPMGLWGHMGTLKVLGGGHPKWASRERAGRVRGRKWVIPHLGSKMGMAV